MGTALVAVGAALATAGRSRDWFLLGIGDIILEIEKKNKGKKEMENKSVGSVFFSINSLY